jgi:hypothetical protein
LPPDLRGAEVVGYIINSRMSFDLFTNNLIREDLNVDDEGFEQRWYEPMQSLHGLVGKCTYELASLRRFCESRTQDRIGKNNFEL